MPENKRWTRLLILSSLLLAFLMQVPQLLYQIDSRSQGVMVRLNEDEGVYLARVQEALSGRPEQASEAFVGGSHLVGSQFSLVERIYGSVFSWTNFRAAHVLQIMDSLIPVMIFLTLILFFQLCGFDRKTAFAGALFFVLLQFDGLNRPVHQRSGTLLVLLSLTGILQGLRGHTLLGIIGGALLGILVGVYFWSFTFAWLWFALLLLWEGIEWWRARKDGTSLHAVRVLTLFGVIGLCTALPFIGNYLELMQHPLSDVSLFRSGMRSSRLPESWPYSILFAGMVAGALLTFHSKPQESRRYQGALLLIITAFAVIHQQVIHGTVFNFVSHYLFLLIISAISVLLLAWSVRTKYLLFSGLCAAVYLSGIAYDERGVFSLFRVQEASFNEQHFASALPILDALPRSQILTDPSTSMFLAATTKHDVMYSIYLKNVLMSHTEIAERYCLTQLPVLPRNRRITENRFLIYPDANSAFREDPTVREREVAMVKEACARFDRDPEKALQQYGVTHVLWDEKRQPMWDVTKLGSLNLLERSEGWSLWSISQDSHAV